MRLRTRWPWLLTIWMVSAGSLAVFCGVRAAQIFAWSDVGPAAADGRTTVLWFCSMVGTDLDAPRYQDGSAPLHAAAISGETDAVALLLRHGARTDVTDQKGWTPLHRASDIGHADVVRALIAAGADGLTP